MLLELFNRKEDAVSNGFCIEDVELRAFVFKVDNGKHYLKVQVAEKSKPNAEIFKGEVVFSISRDFVDSTLEDLYEEARKEARERGISHVNNLDDERKES